MLRFSKERRVIGRDRVQQLHELVAGLVVFDEAQVLAECAEAAGAHVLLQPGGDERPLAIVEGDAAPGIDELRDGLQVLLRQLERISHEPSSLSSWLRRSEQPIEVEEHGHLVLRRGHSNDASRCVSFAEIRQRFDLASGDRQHL